uniref:K Homology domain-containing protein n=1 Tax=Timema tahoe TaxID=61484 RepID=A0A7R9IGA3_9NEOP|nr:unnamed protein product [Timema tahoe]
MTSHWFSSYVEWPSVTSHPSSLVRWRKGWGARAAWRGLVTSVRADQYGASGRGSSPPSWCHTHRIRSPAGMKRDADGDMGTPQKRSRPGGDTEVRLLIPSKAAGSIIGKGGHNITKLRTEVSFLLVVWILNIHL